MKFKSTTMNKWHNFFLMDAIYMDIKCSSCDNEAEIFHGRRFLCLQCWNKIKEASQEQSDNIY